MTIMRDVPAVFALLLFATSGIACEEPLSKRIEREAREGNFPVFLHSEIVSSLQETTEESLHIPRMAAATYGMYRDDDEVSVGWWWIEAQPPMRSFVITNETTGESIIVKIADDVSSWTEQLETEGKNKLVHRWGARVPVSFLGDEAESRIVVAVKASGSAAKAVRFQPGVHVRHRAN